MKRKIFSILFAVVVAVSLVMVPAAVSADADGLIAYYLLDGNADDASGYDNHGTVVGAGATFGGGNIAPISPNLDAIDFDGGGTNADPDYVCVADDPHLTPSGTAVTLSAWIFPEDVTAPIDMIFGKWNDLNREYELQLRQGEVWFFVKTGTTDYKWARSDSLMANNWYHVAGVYDGSTMQIYVNGAPSGAPVSQSGTIPDTIARLTIGAQNFKGSWASFFNGVIDEVRIYDRALDCDEIAALASPTCVVPPDDLVSWWDGDSISGTTAIDIQDGNDGTLMNDATTATGKVGDAFSFDGVGDYVEIPYAIEAVSAITMDAWVYLPSLPSTDAEIISKWDGSGYGVIHFEIAPGGTVRMCLRSGLHDYIVEFYSTESLPINEWVHVAETWDGSEAKIYFNGVEKGSLSGAGTIRHNEDMKYWIGSAYGTFRFFNGLIDEVEIFDRALSASEIQAIYNAGSAGKCKVVPLDHFLGYKVKTTKVCDGGVTELTLKYLGDTTVDIVVTAKEGVVFGPEEVDSGAQFSFGTAGVKLGTSIDIFVNDVLATTIHTSCSQPIYQGQTFGAFFEVVEGESLKGGPLETPEPDFVKREVTLTDQFATGLFKVEKPDKLYNPADKNDEGINDPNTHLMSYKVKLIQYDPEPACAPCKGGLTSLTLQYNGSSAALVVVTGGSVPFEETLNPGQVFTIVGGGKDGKLDKDVTITVDSVLEATIHTSCSQPIGTGQTFGDFTVVAGESKDGGSLCPIITVESQFGTIVVARDKPDRLLVPTAKSLTGPVEPLDETGVGHFLGYKIKAPKDMEVVQVTVVDQFGQPKVYDVKKPTRLFVPVDKDGEVIKNPEAHLICYTIKPAKDQPKHINVLGIYTNNQFGLLKLNTDKEEELLVPCQKIVPLNLCGD